MHDQYSLIKEFKILGRLFKQIVYHIRYKYYQCCDLVKNFPLGNDEKVRRRLIDSIEELKDKNKNR